MCKGSTISILSKYGLWEGFVSSRFNDEQRTEAEVSSWCEGSTPSYRHGLQKDDFCSELGQQHERLATRMLRTIQTRLLHRMIPCNEETMEEGLNREPSLPTNLS